jgi:hypothetical protein
MHRTTNYGTGRFYFFMIGFGFVVATLLLCNTGCLASAIDDKVNDATQQCEDIARAIQEEALAQCDEIISEQIEATQAWCEAEAEEQLDELQEWIEQLLETREEEVLTSLGCERDGSDLGWDCQGSVLCD